MTLFQRPLKCHAKLLTWIVFLGGKVLWKDFSLELSVVFILGQPASMREVPFLSERWTVDIDALQEPRTSPSSVVMPNST